MEVMEKAKNTFISSMFWSERIGYSAGLATLEKMGKVHAQEHMMLAGSLVKYVWASAAEEAGLEIEITGLDPLATFAFKDDPNLAMITTFTQEMLKRGYLAAGQFYPSVRHRAFDTERFEKEVHEVFSDIASGKAVLEGPPSIPGFRRLA